jgi:plastocyanin
MRSLVLSLGALAAAGIFPVQTPAQAAGFAALVTDDAGKPVADAVVSLEPTAGAVSQAPSRESLANATIDQRDETFVPYVTIIGQGGAVTFRNSDETRHHVYTFSPIKPFEFVLKPGDSSPPVIFDQTGVATIGCNIHDHMIAYVYVAKTPWVAQSDAAGHIAIADAPAGAYQATVWHPQLRPGRAPAPVPVTVGAGGAPVTFALSLLPDRRQRHGSDHRTY